MNWFLRLRSNPYVEMVLITDNEGHILLSSRSMPSRDELIASMIQSAEVLAQSLSEELERGAMQMLQISTDKAHILVFPLAFSVFHLVVVVMYSAPLATIIPLVERIVSAINPAELAQLQTPPSAPAGEEDDLDAEELIEAVRQWLHNRSTNAE